MTVVLETVQIVKGSSLSLSLTSKTVWCWTREGSNRKIGQLPRLNCQDTGMIVTYV